MFWKIEETCGQYYITWEGIYASREGAQAAIDRLPVEQRKYCRPALYQTGAYRAERVEA